MEGFNTSTMTYLTPNLNIQGVGDQNEQQQYTDSYNPGMFAMDMQDHFSNFDANTFAGSEDMSLHPMQQPTHFGQISPLSTRAFAPPPPPPQPQPLYEEPFSDAFATVDGQQQDDPDIPESPSIERDHELLRFSQPTFDYLLLDHHGQQTSLSLTAQLHGMFYHAEAPKSAESQMASVQNEITCYRRNLFQITGNATLPRNLRSIMTDQGQVIPIIAQELSVSATESTEGNTIKLISVPWKTPASGQPSTNDKTEKEPQPVSLDLMNVQQDDLGVDFQSFPFQFKRLQFRIATANNGRRKELQQHFVVHLKMMVTLSTGQKVRLCEVHSNAMICRGRSPRNFQGRKDVALSGAGSHARKQSQLPTSAAPQISRHSTTDSFGKRQNADTDSNINAKSENPQPAMSVIESYYDPNEYGIQPHLMTNYVANAPVHGALTALPPDAAPFQIEGYAASSPDLMRKPPIPRLSAPINLSLTDEPAQPPPPPPKSKSPANFAPNKSPAAPQSTLWQGKTPDPPSSSAIKRETPTPSKPPFPASARAPSFGITNISSPDDSCDMLYEYFPLGLDDWMPPVDAVYRPHVVHHINVAADPRDPATKVLNGRSKRYFSETVERTNSFD